MAQPGSPATETGRADNGARQAPPGRAWPADVLTAAAIIATVALALLTAGCGGGGSPALPAGGAGLPAGTAQALAYATCMRSHGIPGFPDPNPPGSGGVFSLGRIDTHSPQFQPADRTCQKQTGFGHFSTAQQQQGMAAMMNYAKCMRAHGITNYPDPSANSQQIGFNLTGTGIDLRSPKVEAASKTCQPFWPSPP